MLFRSHVKVVSKETFSELTKEKQTQGVLAYVKDYQFGDLNALTKNPKKFPVVVALDHLQDPYNFGAIVRTCETLGVDTILFPKDRSASLSPGMIKASSGAVYYSNLVKVTNLAQSLLTLKKAGYWVYGTDADQGENLDTFASNCNLPMVLVVGNEDKGVSPRVQKIVDAHIRIPLKGQVPSMNVSVATGIILYQITQQLDMA